MKKVPRYFGLRMFLASIGMYLLLVAPINAFLFLKHIPEFFHSRNIKYLHVAINDTTLAHKVDSFVQETVKKGYLKDSIRLVYINYHDIDTVFTGEDFINDKIDVGKIFQESKVQPQDALSQSNDLFFRVLGVSFILGFIFNLPFKIYFNRLRKQRNFPAPIKRYVKKLIFYTPLINTVILLSGYLVVQIFMISKIGNTEIFTHKAEQNIYLGVVIVSGIASLLAVLFIFYWQKHRVQIKYIHHIFNSEELRSRVFPFRHQSIQNRLLISSLMTTLLPLTLVIFYILLSVTPVNKVKIPDLQAEHLKFVFGKYNDVLPIELINEPEFMDKLVYINSIDTLLMFLGIASSIISAFVYILFFVKWTKEDITLPVKELLMYMNKTGEQGVNYYSIVRSNDEIGELAEGYNRMTSKLREYFDRISSMNEHLEFKVRERTAEIEQQTEEIKVQRDNLRQLNQQLGEQKEEIQSALMNLKEAQSQLVQSEKMASLGQLTAGIAHEINNPINFVSSNINPLKLDIEDLKAVIQKCQEIKPGNNNIEQHIQSLNQLSEELNVEFLLQEIDNLVSGIDEGAKRTKEIVLSLRNFSRVDEDNLKRTDIHVGIDSTLTLLKNKWKKRITIHKNYGSLPEIECYPGKINQVFMNILMNAIQAIKNDGDIFITSSVSQKLSPDGNNMIEISIRDTGKGMAHEIQKHIFDPFYTTKEVGEGTGLGLSISYGIIKTHNGEITVNSELDKGSEFIIFLPVHQYKETGNV